MDISNIKTKRIIMQVMTFLSSQEHLSIFLLFLLLRIAAVSSPCSSQTQQATVVS